QTPCSRFSPGLVFRSPELLRVRRISGRFVQSLGVCSGPRCGPLFAIRADGRLGFCGRRASGSSWSTRTGRAFFGLLPEQGLERFDRRETLQPASGPWLGNLRRGGGRGGGGIPRRCGDRDSSRLRPWRQVGASRTKVVPGGNSRRFGTALPIE